METSNKYFEIKVSFQTENPNGTKKVTESYLAKAVSHADAENKIIEQLIDLSESGLQVKSVSKRSVSELFVSENENATRWYRSRVSIITIDEKKGSEKKQMINLYVQASNFDDAVKSTKSMLKGSMSDWEIASVTETKIVEYFD